MKIWRVEIADTIPPVGKLFDKGTPVVRKFTVIDFNDLTEERFVRHLVTRYGETRIVNYSLGE